MTASARRRESGQRDNSTAQLILFAVVMGIAALAYVAFRAGRALQGMSEPIPANPITDAIWIAQGKLQWPIASTVLLAVFALTVVVTAIAVARKRAAGAVVRDLDQAAAFMATPKELSAITAKDAKKSAAALRPGADVSAPEDWGLQLGRTVGSVKVPLYVTWEWVGLVIGGPRSGKTTAYATPMVCQAPGAVFVTSNKPDIHDDTCWVRDDTNPAPVAVRGRRHRDAVRGTIWRYDLQDVASTDALAWWWNPLRGIDALNDARELASIFKGASTEESARVDAYFDGGAQELLALYILAAAVGGGDLKHVHSWLGNAQLEVPLEMLRRHDCYDAAAGIATAQSLNKRQQDGLYDMARRFVNVMTVPRYAQSVLPPRRKVFDNDNTTTPADLGHHLPEFDPTAFVTSTDTLYALSMEGAGAATALTTALADCIFKAARREAVRNGGRLRVPLVAVLDEAANVCKLPHLPEWYSFFGSAGINVVTFFQSLAQASMVWNDTKLSILRSASNATVFGGGSDDARYLEDLSKLIGSRDVRRQSRTTNGSGGVMSSTSYGESWSNEPILSPDKLKALHPSRAVLLTHGNRAVLVAKNFHWTGPYAAAIKASHERCAADRADRITASRTAGIHTPKEMV